MLRLALFLYSFIYAVALTLYLPYYWYRIRFRDRSQVLLSQRWGRTPQPEGERPTIWIHAVSVGEVNAVRPLAVLLQRSHHLCLSTTTDTGQRQAAQVLGPETTTFYFPFDFQWTCRRALKRTRPQAVIMTESEIWPGFLSAAHRLGIPVFLVNGRISDRTFSRYLRVRPIASRLLSGYSALCMQSREDKKKMVALGAPPARVHWTGNLKYDYALPPHPEMDALAARLRKSLRPGADDRIWVCGSTRSGEEELLMDVFEHLRSKHESLRLLIAPRHPHRADQVATLFADKGSETLKRSSMDDDSESRSDVLVLDTIGELAYLYAIADAVFIGGSLKPYGGQNPIEAAYFAKPILFGPSMENFREVSETFLEAYGALQVESVEQLTDRLDHLLSDAVSAQWLGRNARKVVRENQGAVERTHSLVVQHLN